MNFQKLLSPIYPYTTLFRSPPPPSTSLIDGRVHSSWNPIQPEPRGRNKQRDVAWALRKDVHAKSSARRCSTWSGVVSWARTSSLTKICRAVSNIFRSPVESPFSRSRMARLRTTSATSKMFPDLIFSMLARKRRFQLLDISVSRSEEHTSELQSRENLVC